MAWLNELRWPLFLRGDAVAPCLFGPRRGEATTCDTPPSSLTPIFLKTSICFYFYFDKIQILKAKMLLLIIIVSVATNVYTRSVEV